MTVGGFGDDYFNGMWALLTDGSHVGRELFIRDYDFRQNHFTFLPVLDMAPDGSKLEIYPFRPAEFLTGVKHAIQIAMMRAS